MKLKGLYACDLVCLGAASPGAFAGYMEWLDESFGADVAEYEHRGGWAPWGVYRERARAEGAGWECGTVRTLAWQRLWSRYLLRPSCHACGHHSVVRPGNVSIGDFWGSRDAHPGLGDRLGLSCLLANDGRGLALVEAAAPSLALVSSDLAKCANGAQPMLSRSPELPGGRNSFWEAMSEGGFGRAAAAMGAAGPLRTAKDALRKTMGRDDVDVDYGSTVGPARFVTQDELAAMEAEGGYPYVFAAKNRSDEVRARSSSGGMFHALASAVIANGGVVYGCAFDERLQAAHVRCETMAEAERCMGSKYSQSRMGSAIADVRADLRAGRAVLFTGTPCQVDAVRKSCEGLGGGALDC